MNESNQQNTHAEHNDTGTNIGKWVGAAVAGALLMYAFDPERGAARRSRARGALLDAGHRGGERLENAWHSAGDRFDSARSRASSRASNLYASASERLAGAAHAAGERLTEASHHARDRFEHARERLSDNAHDTRERLSDASYEARERAAHAAAYAADKARERSAHVRERASRLADDARDQSASFADQASDKARDVADRLDGAARRAGSQARERAHAVSDRVAEWGGHLAHVFGSRSPTLTNSALLGTGALSVVGLARRSPVAALLGLGALAVLLRSDRGRNLVDSLRTRGAGSASQVEVENAIHIDASPKQVYDAWSEVENFPHFMSHVTEVRDLGHRRSHWKVTGPAGLEYAWNAVMTEQSRPDRLAWRSEPGSEIEQEGTVTFEPSRGGTLVTVRMRYAPPAGALGHGIARMLGIDPQRQMDDDLVRMKQFIEDGASHGGSRSASHGSSRDASRQPASSRGSLH